MEQPWLASYDKGVPATITYPRVSLFQVLDNMARKYGSRVATKLILRYLGPMTLGGELTYAQLLAQVNRFAAALHSLGVRKGDRIAIMVPNLPQFVISFYGAARLGAIVVNTNPTYTSREMEHQFADAGAETVVLLSPYYRKLKEIQAHTAVRRVIVTDVTEYATGLTKALANRKLRHEGLMVDVPEGDGVYHFRKLLDAHPDAPPAVAIDPDETALFQYTGGTTGVPKAAMLSHYNLVTRYRWTVG
jgi:long-chain acyl-CoA synthetase